MIRATWVVADLSTSLRYVGKTIALVWVLCRLRISASRACSTGLLIEPTASTVADAVAADAEDLLATAAVEALLVTAAADVLLVTKFAVTLVGSHLGGNSSLLENNSDRFQES